MAAYNTVRELIDALAVPMSVLPGALALKHHLFPSIVCGGTTGKWVQTFTISGLRFDSACLRVWLGIGDKFASYIESWTHLL